ncbi:MlaA family lipoprotein [Parasalinivibrio latis]|uniref:MlaA family lipoprotein n=1 Tax=Parasalinivibrio latis TaxID=2952610 RepID=UPI0030DE0AA1
MRKALIISLLSVLFVSGCASNRTVAEKEATAHPDDPFEGFNRAMWTVNYDYLDPYVARPVSVAYVDYVPTPVRSGITNFLSNLEEPFSMVNSLVMLEGEQASNHFGRFFMNTIFGLGGLIDVASRAGIPNEGDTEFGDAIGHYGVGNGPYFMFPVYGPTTLREGAGGVVDGLYPVMSLLTLPQSILKWVFQGMEDRAAMVQQEELLERSPDPYITVRDAYLQNQDFKAGIERKPDPEEDAFLDDFMDEIDGE